MKCPCKECISYAICVNKRSIICDNLREYISYLNQELNLPPREEIIKYFPKLEVVYREVDTRL